MTGPNSTPSNDDKLLRQLFDRQEIYALLMRFARGVDRRDYDLARSVYHSDALDHRAGFDGKAMDFMDHLPSVCDRLTTVHHFLGNVVIELREDRAVAETYGILTSRGEPATDRILNFTSGFRYVDTLERRLGVWGITERWVVREWQRTDVACLMPMQTVGPNAVRGSGDPLYQAMEYLNCV